ncbi:MAG: AAA family ATPase, partial [Bacteroidota bacterium]
YWRNSSGKEIDILLYKGGKIKPIEIKSGQTISSDFFKHLNWFRDISDLPIELPTVIYGGDPSIETSDGWIRSWRTLNGEFQSQ